MDFETLGMVGALGSGTFPRMNLGYTQNILDTFDLTLLVPPASLTCVTPTQAQLYSRAPTGDENTTFQLFIDGAVSCLEGELGRSFLTQQWRMAFNLLPSDGVIKLWFPPVKSVQHFRCYDDFGNSFEVDPSLYQLDLAAEPGKIILSRNFTPPQMTANLRRGNAWEIEFTTGYDAEPTANATPALATGVIPGALALMVQQLVSIWFQDRNLIDHIPEGFITAGNKYRIYTF